MGLYFPDIARPKGGPCPLRQDAPFRAPYCPIYNVCRGDACPAVDVGHHGRLIDADALAAKCDSPYWCVWLSDIDDALTVVAAEEA